MHFFLSRNWKNEIESSAKEDTLLHNLLENFVAGQSSNILPAIDDLFIQRELYNQECSCYWHI